MGPGPAHSFTCRCQPGPHATGQRQPGRIDVGREDTTQVLEAFLREQERAYIRQALTRHDWQIGITADALGISRKNLWERMKRLSIQ